MTEYRAPQRDMKFVMDELLELPAHYASLPGCEEVTSDLVSAIRDEAAKFATNVIYPLNKVGDEEGCTWADGVVTTPTGFKEANAQYREAGWNGLTWSSEWGGQGLPPTVGAMFHEIISSANFAWGVFGAGTGGAIKTIETWGTLQQKETYLSRLVSGEWNATSASHGRGRRRTSPARARGRRARCRSGPGPGAPAEKGARLPSTRHGGAAPARGPQAGRP